MVAMPVTDGVRLTPEEFLALPDASGWELDDGLLVERNVSVESSEVGAAITVQIGAFARSGRLGIVLGPDIGLQIFPNPRRIPKPDVAFIAAGRVTPEVRRSGFLRIPPDLVVEVVSPGDSASALQRKVDEYLSAGVRLVWVVYPESRKAVVFRADGTVAMVPPEGALDGEDVLPGLSLPLASVLPEPEPAAPEDA